jgi:hypothetical protein
MRQVLFSNDFVRDYQGLPESLRKKTGERKFSHVVADFRVRRAT